MKSSMSFCHSLDSSSNVFPPEMNAQKIVFFLLSSISKQAREGSFEKGRTPVTVARLCETIIDS
jgi:hypothetical protein